MEIAVLWLEVFIKLHNALIKSGEKSIPAHIYLENRESGVGSRESEKIDFHRFRTYAEPLHVGWALPTPLLAVALKSAWLTNNGATG